MIRKPVSVFRKVQYEVAVCSILLLQLCYYLPSMNQMNSWITTPYALSYRFGFSSRFFVGSVIQLFTDHLSASLLWVIIFATLVMLILMISVISGRLIRSSENSTKPFIILVIAFFLSSPVSVAYLFDWTMYGRFDTYLLLFAIVAICLIRTKVFRWFIPLLCIMLSAIHQIFIFTYAPLIVLVLLYEMLQNRFSKDSILLFGFTVLAIGGSFIIFQFFTGSLNVDSLDEMIRNISAYSSVPILRTMLQLEYFSPLTEATTGTSILALPRLFIYSSVSLILMSPLIIGLYSFWIQCRKQTTEKLKRAMFLLIMLSPVFFAPAFLLTVDWGRYIVPIFITHFFFLLYLLYRKDTVVIQTAALMNEKYQKAWPTLLLVLVYHAALGKFECNAALHIVARVLEFIEAYLAKLL